MKHNTSVLLTMLTIAMGCVLFSGLASTLPDRSPDHALVVPVGDAPRPGMKMVYQSTWVDGATLHVRSVLEPCTADKGETFQPYECLVRVPREVTRVDSRIGIAPNRGGLRGICVTLGEMLCRTAFPSSLFLGN